MLISLNCYPSIRYFKNNSEFNSHLQSDSTKRVAKLVLKKLALYKRENPDFGVADNETNATSEVVVLERNFDLISPLMHEMTYQAMVMDMFANVSENTSSDIITFEGNDGLVTMSLDETDPVWTRFRGGHLLDLTTELPEMFNAVNRKAKQEQLQ